jgi:hypothetical protein
VAVDFSSLTSCTQLREVHIAQAATSSAAMRALLKRFAELATPGKGAPVIIAALARLGTTACDWIDGELRIEISGDASKTVIAVSSSLGAGFAEKVFPDSVLKVPLDEFKRFVERADPKLLEPLTVLQNDRIIVLAVAAEVRKSTIPPPNNEIDPSSMFKLPAHPTPSVPMQTPALAIPTKK